MCINFLYSRKMSSQYFVRHIISVTWATLLTFLSTTESKQKFSKEKIALYTFFEYDVNLSNVWCLSGTSCHCYRSPKKKKKNLPFSEIKNTNNVEPFTFFGVLRTYFYKLMSKFSIKIYPNLLVYSKNMRFLAEILQFYVTRRQGNCLHNYFTFLK